MTTITIERTEEENTIIANYILIRMEILHTLPGSPQRDKDIALTRALAIKLGKTTGDWEKQQKRP